MCHAAAMTAEDEAYEEYERAMIKWAQSYNGYERIADDSGRLNAIYRPLAEEIASRGDLPDGLGVDLLRGWAFYLARAHRWSGGSRTLIEHVPEIELVAEAIRRHPAAEPRDMPPSRGR